MTNIKYNYRGHSNDHRIKKSGRKGCFLSFFLIVIFTILAFWAYNKFFKQETKKITPDTLQVNPNTIEETKKTTDKKTETKVVSPNLPNPKKLDKNLENSKKIIEKKLPKVPAKKATLDLKEIKAVLADQDYHKAQELLLKKLPVYNSTGAVSQDYANLGKILRQVNVRILERGIPGGNNKRYRVNSGDNLSSIAVRFNLPITAIQKANKIKNSMIYPGQVLTVYQGDWRIEVNKLSKLLLVFDGDNLFAIYDIGIGKEGRTPVGDFILTDKIANPDWYSPDGKIVPYGQKENVLGTHWLKLEPTGKTSRFAIGYGIHGTWDTGSISKSLSNGCIRMKNSDVAELFNYIPRQTKVKIY